MSDSPPLVAPRSRATVLVLACGAIFLAMLDTTVTNLAVPDLHVDFPAASVTTLSWVITGYAVALAALLMPAGRLADALGRRLVYRAGLLVFTACSLIAALAPGMGILIAARAVQGAGAAALIPASLALVLHDMPAERRAAAIGLWAASSAGAAAVGPALGGVLVDAFGWRSLFLINVPIGAALGLLTRRVPGARPTGARRPDTVGTALLAAGVAALVVGLTEGDTWHWGSAGTLAALVGGPLLVAAALVRSTRHPAPAAPVGLWRRPGFAVANLASLCYGASLYPGMLIGVLYLTDGWRYSELRTGLAVTPAAVAAGVAAVVVGRRLGRRGPRPAVVLGGLAYAAMLGISVVWLPTSPHFLAWWLPVGTAMGLGIGGLVTGTSTAAAMAVPPAEFAAATGLNTAARQVGGAIGIAALAVIQQAETGIARYHGGYLFCALAALAAAAAGVALRRPARASAPQPAPAAVEVAS